MPTATHEKQTVRVGKRELTLSNLDKILYPVTGFTKGQVIDYYARIAPIILPHLKHRALTLKRYPNGVDDMFFYEKNCTQHRPAWVQTIPMQTENKKINFCTIDDAPALVWVANLASIELHVLLSKAPNLDQPTAIAFDFDPGPPAGRLEAMPAALLVRGLLDDLGLESFPKTSGGKGVHVYVPLNTPATFDQTKSFARDFARQLESKHPDLITSNMLKKERTGRVFMDWSQNDRHKTTVCAYSMRAREHPTVSTPITWAELEKAAKKKDPDLLVFETDDVLERVDKEGDLFAPVLKLKQKLPRS